MTRLIIIILISAAPLLFYGCNSTGYKEFPTYSDAGRNENHNEINNQYCFRKLSGNENRDTLSIRIRIDSNLVTGEMTDAIFEKDKRQGRLLGQLDKEYIKATWIYIQEGILENLDLEFRLLDGQILMAPIVYDVQSGRQSFDKKTSAWVVIPEVECQSSEKEQGLTVNGTVIAITKGKDGYNAIIKKGNGDSVQISMSRVRLQNKYTIFKVGDLVTVSGDIINLNQNEIILVDYFQKGR